jgi:hypothetical protein
MEANEEEHVRRLFPLNCNTVKAYPGWGGGRMRGMNGEEGHQSPQFGRFH